MALNEAVQLIRGDARFVADRPDSRLASAAHVVFVRSTMAHARFSVDTSDAKAAPGVLAVVTAADNPIWPTHAHSDTHPARFAQPLLAEVKVRFVGEAVAAVVAETHELALDAAEAVVVDYEPLEPVVSAATAIAGDSLLFDDGSHARRNRHSPPDDGAPSNVLRTDADDPIAPDTTEGQLDAEVVIAHDFVNPRQVAAPMECRGAAALWTDDGHMHLWMSTQTPHAFRSRLAPMYDLALSQIHIVAGPFVGGGFGGKGSPGPEEQLVPHLAQMVGRPVQWIESRSENLTSAPQGRAEEIQLTLAGTRDGDFQAVKARLLKDSGAYPSSGASLPNNWSGPMVGGTYRIAHTGFEQTTYVSNRPPVSALRGAGRAPMLHALERAVDMFAAEIAMDPAEVRRRNLLGVDDFPYESPTGARYDDANYADALERVLKLSDYDELRADQAARRQSSATTQLGIGIASYNHRTCGGGGESALVRINTDGSATVVTGTTSQGQDHQGTWRTIAAGELGIAPERITVIEGVTDEIATGVGAVGSRSVQTAGLAIHEASADVVAQARSIAAELLEAAEGDIVLDRAIGSFHVTGTPAVAIDWAELATEMRARDKQLSCDHVYNNDGNDVYPSGCHVAVVEVDTETGGWKLVRYSAVDDAGVRINPTAVEGQLRGGIALGVAQVLGEVSDFDDDGNPLATNFLDYQIASIDQFCQIDLEAQVIPSSFNAGGYKAVGESGPIGATPAVHNAVVDALKPFGVRDLPLPCTPERVWRAINDR
jgi:CO/xanthine dehydrogenase Mo-binding subunit